MDFFGFNTNPNYPRNEMISYAAPFQKHKRLLTHTVQTINLLGALGLKFLLFC